MRNTSSTFHSPWRSALLSGAAVFAIAVGAVAQPFDSIGLRAHGARLLVEANPGHDGPGAADDFGFEVAAGDFDGNGFDDLAIGAPRREFSNTIPDAGGVAVLFARLFFDGFETGDLTEWSDRLVAPEN